MYITDDVNIRTVYGVYETTLLGKLINIQMNKTMLHYNDHYCQRECTALALTDCHRCAGYIAHANITCSLIYRKSNAKNNLDPEIQVKLLIAIKKRWWTDEGSKVFHFRNLTFNQIQKQIVSEGVLIIL